MPGAGWWSARRTSPGRGVNREPVATLCPPSPLRYPERRRARPEPNSERTDMTQSAPTVPHSVPSRDESWVYFDGEIRRYGDSRLGILTHALHYGTGCFEG